MQKVTFTSPQDAETAFYEALERADLNALMAVWAEDEDIVCILPGGVRMTGYANVRDIWQRIFESGRRLKVQVSHQMIQQSMATSIHHLSEHIGLAGDHGNQTAPILTTNIFVRGALGWRLLVHHASLAPVEDEAFSNRKTLH